MQRVAEKAAVCLKTARFVSIPEATHWIPHDQPQKFNQVLLDVSRKHTVRPNELVQRVDHLVYATPDLDRGIAEIEKLVGVRATLGGKHPGRGTRNAFIALGPNSFLEIVAPDPDQPPPKEPRPFFQGPYGIKLVRWFINSRDIDAHSGRGRQQGRALRRSETGQQTEAGWGSSFVAVHRPVETRGRRRRAFHYRLGRHTSPSQSAAKGATLIRLRAEHPDPRYAKRLLLALGLKLPVEKANRPALIATIEGPRGRVELK